MPIDYDRAREIVDRFRGLDPYQAYYVKDEVHVEWIGPLVPDACDVLRRAFAHSKEVLDVGCGDGRTLLENAELFGHGVGIDESADHMIANAIRARDVKGIRNVDFRAAKAVELPFAVDTFDMVFSERGPLGHSDHTLKEALRVLQPGGLIFVETGGDYNTLGIEKRRFESHGVRIQTLLARSYTQVFKDFYEFLKLRCSALVYMGEELPRPGDRERLDSMLSEATDQNGRIVSEHAMIWVAGTKEAEPSHPTDAAEPGG